MNLKEQLLEAENENAVVSYWNNNGKYQVENNLMSRLIPNYGPFICPENKKLEHSIESLRKLKNIYYEYMNNGCCNAVETIFEECYECGGSGWEYNRFDDDEDQRDCSCCGGDCKVEVETIISENYKDMVSDLENYVQDKTLSKIIINQGKNCYQNVDTRDQKLEEFADKVINESWLRFINLK